jgi:hypothetical protein
MHLKLFIAVLVLGLLSCGLAAEPARPNFILFIADMACDDCGASGGRAVRFYRTTNQHE